MYSVTTRTYSRSSSLRCALSGLNAFSLFDRSLPPLPRNLQRHRDTDAIRCEPQKRSPERGTGEPYNLSAPQAMSSSVDVQQPSGIWSYFSSNSTSTTTRNRRTSSVSLPKHASIANGTPFEGRHATSNGQPDFVHAAKAAWMNQGQRARYLKAGGLIAFVLLIFWFLAPGEKSRIPYGGGM
jgi:hypothetical protein